MTWIGCLAREQFEERMVIRYYGGTLIYISIYGHKKIESERTYGEGVMSVSVIISDVHLVHL